MIKNLRIKSLAINFTKLINNKVTINTNKIQ